MIPHISTCTNSSTYIFGIHISSKLNEHFHTLTSPFICSPMKGSLRESRWSLANEILENTFFISLVLERRHAMEILPSEIRISLPINNKIWWDRAWEKEKKRESECGESLIIVKNEYTEEKKKERAWSYIEKNERDIERGSREYFQNNGWQEHWQWGREKQTSSCEKNLQNTNTHLSSFYLHLPLISPAMQTHSLRASNHSLIHSLKHTK